LFPRQEVSGFLLPADIGEYFTHSAIWSDYLFFNSLLRDKINEITVVSRP
jgi:hypothetical protein